MHARMTSIATSARLGRHQERSVVSVADRVEDGQSSRRPTGRHLSLVGACYVGMVVIVGVFILLRHVIPTPVGAFLYFAAMSALVAVLHPRITRVTLRR